MSLTKGTGPLGPAPGGSFNFDFADAPAHRIYFSEYAPRLRAVLGDRVVLDTRAARLLHETAILPVAYVPLEDFAPDLLERSDTVSHCPFKGDASYWSLQVGDRVVRDAVWAYEQPLERAAWLVGYAALYWRKADAWFVEDERAFGPHIRDPFTRVDVYETSRLVTVRAAGEVIARSARAKLLFETGLAPRVYLPGGDIAPGLLRRSETVTQCPYKGQTVYWHLLAGGRRFEDAAWSYEVALPEADRIRGHVCFEGDGIEVQLGEPDDHLG